ncbi:MAG: DNA double-strand break repair nuclease NurA [Candidatus Aenigmarchaeota archaeon]|nr:DNA double-strand break repair nuclease NurA [Candidatus Aenigmarchaeota archaeon]
METETPFSELPEALVEEMLNKSDELGRDLSNTFKDINDKKSEVRKKLYELEYLKKDSDIITTPSYPTTCGVDGSYGGENLLSTDITAMASVAVEGLIPPKEVKYWENPHYICKILTLQHSDATSLVARAIMMTMELELATKSPHDVVFMDGSLTTPFIYFNQALSRIKDVSPELSSYFIERLGLTLDSYIEVLAAVRSDKIYSSIPKYTSRKEIAKLVGLNNYEDRGLLSFILEPSEFVGPMPLEQPNQEWHINNPLQFSILFDKIISSLKEIYVIYYRPFSHIPALRIEMSKNIALNNNRLSILLESVKLQCVGGGIMEPYPLYLADRMVKHLGTAIPAIRKTMTQEMAGEWGDDVTSLYLAMHGYRT